MLPKLILRDWIENRRTEIIGMVLKIFKKFSFTKPSVKIVNFHQTGDQKTHFASQSLRRKERNGIPYNRKNLLLVTS